MGDGNSGFAPPARCDVSCNHERGPFPMLMHACLKAARNRAREMLQQRSGDHYQRRRHHHQLAPSLYIPTRYMAEECLAAGLSQGRRAVGIDLSEAKAASEPSHSGTAAAAGVICRRARRPGTDGTGTRTERLARLIMRIDGCLLSGEARPIYTDEVQFRAEHDGSLDGGVTVRGESQSDWRLG